MLKIFFISLVLGYASRALCQEVPFVNQDPKADKKLTPQTFKFISDILHTDKLSENLRCALTTRSSRTLRKFHDGEQWVEQLEVKFSSNGFDSGMKMNFVIAETAMYGTQKTANQWSAVGEEFRIELGDDYGHWLQFTHDGRGHIIGIMVGNLLRIVPCQTKF